MELMLPVRTHSPLQLNMASTVSLPPNVALYTSPKHNFGTHTTYHVDVALLASHQADVGSSVSHVPNATPKISCHDNVVTPISCMISLGPQTPYLNAGSTHAPPIQAIYQTFQLSNMARQTPTLIMSNHISGRANMGLQSSYVPDVGPPASKVLNVGQRLPNIANVGSLASPCPNVDPSSLHGCNVASPASSFCKHRLIISISS